MDNGIKPNQIGIITPYSAQVNYIFDFFSKNGGVGEGKIRFILIFYRRKI